MDLAQTCPARTDRMGTGIACGVGAGALWGLVFLAPELARAFSPIELAIGRYLCYGLISVTLLLPRLRRLLHDIGGKGLLALCWLSLTGNIIYYILVSSAVQMGGIAMTSLVVGFLPVTVTIIGSRDRAAVPLAKLAPSLLLCTGGALCIGWQALGAAGSGTGSGAASMIRLIGFVCALGALISWTCYAVGNSRWLHRLGSVSAQEWNLLIGVVTGAQAIMLIPVALLIGTSGHGAADWIHFAAVSAGVAVLASIFGNALWNQMSRLLPLTMIGQMILFETLFALVYGFIWEQRLPTAFETAAFVLLVLSVTTCLAAHRKPAGPTLATAG